MRKLIIHDGRHAHEEACGKTLGIVGFGTMGRAVAQRALAFDMRVLAICDGAAPHCQDEPVFEAVETR
jgi:phosphoglycerate dehydrogenase-like enzyme